MPDDVTASRPADGEVIPPATKPRKELPPLEAGSDPLPVIPRTLDEIARYAEWIMKAGMIPASYEAEAKDVTGDLKTHDERVKAAAEMTRARIMIGIEKGLEVGMGPVTALSTIMIVNNRPCVWGDGAVALCQQKNKVDWVRQRFSGTENADDWTAVFTIKRRGQDEPYEASFSVRDAKRAHLWNNQRKQPWILYPQRMLMARARAYALREGFADCLMGLGIAEEIQDLPAPPAAKTSADFLEDAPRSTPALPPPTDQPMPAIVTAEREPEPAHLIAPAAASIEKPTLPTPPRHLADYPAYVVALVKWLAVATDAEVDDCLKAHAKPLQYIQDNLPKQWDSVSLALDARRLKAM